MDYRSHRIGQTKVVLVLRLVSLGPENNTYSVEQKILHKATRYCKIMSTMLFIIQTYRKLEAGKQILADRKFDMGTTINKKNNDMNDFGCDDNDRLFDDDNNNKESVLSLFESSEGIKADRNDSNIIFSIDLLNEICRRNHIASNFDNIIPSGYFNNFSTDEMIANEQLYEWNEWLSLLTIDNNTESNQKSSIEELNNISQINKEIKRFRNCKSNQSLNEDIIWNNSLSTKDHDIANGAVSIVNKKKETVEKSTNPKVIKQRKKNNYYDSNSDEDCDSNSECEDFDENDEDCLSILDEDICVICKRAWVTLDDYNDFVRINDINTNVNPEEVMNILVLCDGCNGSYHLICVGMSFNS